jgi:hypothetical protein
MTFRCFLQALVRSEFNCAEKIAEYRVLWLQLGKLTEDMGNCMGLAYGIQVSLTTILSPIHL